MGLLKDLIDISSLRKENVDLRQQLEQERQRHLDREDRLLDQVLTAAGRYGVADQSTCTGGGVPLPTTKVEPLPLNALQEAQMAAYMEMAQEAGRPITEGLEMFKRFQAGARLPFENDELIIE